MKKEDLERYLVEGLSLEQIGRRVGRSPSTISYHLKKHGLKPVNQGKHASRGAIPELKLRPLVAEAKTIRAIARELDRSPSTVRHWLKKYGLEVQGIKGNREKALAARARGETVVRLRCRHHGETDFYVEPKNAHYKCKRCRMERVAQRRRDAKDQLVRAAGGRCLLCGYDRYLGALQFHHRDRKTKSFGLAIGHTKSLESLLSEARKCLLLCANCHAEVARGVTQIPPEVIRDAWRDDGNLNEEAA